MIKKAASNLNHTNMNKTNKSKKSKTQRQKRDPQRTDGIITKSRIKDSAVKLFSQRKFSEVSVSQISKQAGISIGAFYQYYINKDELFREIVEEIFDNLSVAIDGNSLKEVGLNFINFGIQNVDFIKVIHLNEYSFEWVRHEYDRILRKVSRRFNLTSIGHFYFWSPLRFVVSFSDLLETDIVPEHFVKCLINGLVSQCGGEISNKIFFFEPTRHVLGEDERREKILANAESLFGIYGFEKTQVYDIAKASNIAVGTIYLYFENKLEILKELVRWINKGLRYNVKKALEMCGKCGRLVQEIAGLYAFVKFFKMHFNMYKIVRESQSIDKEIAKEYYTSIYIPYINAVRKAFEDGDLKLKGIYKLEEEIEYLVVFLMSFGHCIGEMYLLNAAFEDESTETLEKFLMELYIYLCHGLEVTQ